MTRQRLRPSQIITTFGPGSIVDLPDDSVMIAGTEHWFDGYKPHRKISEPRLQAALRVVEFRTPPVGSYQEKDIPFVRFPRWRVCPKCERLSNDFRFPKKGDMELPPVPRCDRCNCETYPARLIVACAKGHIDDFPWYRWLHRGQNCGGGNNLYLRGEGKSAALSDLRIECTCGISSRSLAGAMSREAMSECGVRCNRKRPWLNDDPDSEDCGATRTRLYVLQRGASNVYFSVIRSALSIPPWSDPLQAEVASWWGQFQTPLPPAVWPDVIRSRFPAESEERIRDCIARLEGLKTERPSIRREEYDVFNADQDQATEYFEARRQELSDYSGRYVDRLVAISRLREVRALLGFSRIEAPEMDPTMEVFNEAQGVGVTTAPLSAKQLDWLPAVENLGEGVFLRLNRHRLADWEDLDPVKRQAEILLRAYSEWRQKRGLQPLKEQKPRLLLLHTVAHLLMRQMSLDCGYSSASLRERIYSDSEMAGILIYTSAPDSDGSLGGLDATNPDGTQRDSFGRLLNDVVELARICSSDPLCREHDPKRTERLNGAACHACAMVSETSCEFGNRLLDRKMVATLPGGFGKGYFDFDA